MNTDPTIMTCYLCRGQTHYKKLENVPKPFVCICLEKPADKTDYKVCGTCFRGSWWSRSTIFKKFLCPFCEASKSKKIHIGILPTPQNPIIHKPNLSVNWHEVAQHRKDKAEAKAKAERTELANLIAEAISKKIPREVIIPELEDK